MELEKLKEIKTKILEAEKLQGDLFKLVIDEIKEIQKKYDFELEIRLNKMQLQNAINEIDNNNTETGEPLIVRFSPQIFFNKESENKE